MRPLFSILLLATLVGCDPYDFGFEKNPAFVLDEAFEAITNVDTESFLEHTGKEALCIYGNNKGVNYLKDHLGLNPENIDLEASVLETKYYSIPKFVGFWSYYHERYEVHVREKVSSLVILKVIIDCDFGTDEEKDESYVHLSAKKYKKKECKLVKIKPLNFDSLPVPERCENLRVGL